MAQRIALSGSASIDPQKKLYKVQKSEISSLVSKRFGKTKFLAKSILDNADRVYMVDDMVVIVNSASMPRTQGFLKGRKLMFDDVGLKLSNYSSKIETVSGKNVFVINEISEGLKICRFTTVNSSEDFVVIGFIQYNPGNEIKARSVLEDIIKGLNY